MSHVSPRLVLCALAPLLVSLYGCGPDQELAPTGDDTAIGSDSDTNANSDSDSNPDTDDTASAATITSVEAKLVPAATTITTRDTVHVVVTATWSDGSTTDVTADSEIRSSEPTVLNFFAHDIGQPLLAGTVNIQVHPEDGPDPAPIPLTVTLADLRAGDLVFNELLIDPATTADPNKDGKSDAVDDEFVEIANASGVTVDLGGVTFWDAGLDTPRHTFASPTILQAGQVIVLFGGGTVAALSAANAQFVVAANADVGLQHGIAMNNEGDVANLRAADGTTTLASTPFGTSGGPAVVSDASLVLSPEVSGTSYTHHGYVSGSIGAQSPGTHADGTAFPGPSGVYPR
jgi:hypothetical protein